LQQILQSARSGDLELVEVPAPAPQRGQILVRNAFSVVSPGTERLMLGFARKSLVAKARSRPDLVRQVVRKVRHDGPLATYRAAMTRLDAPQPLGYSCAGVVEAVGPEVAGFAPGDRVACAGAGYANHAELIVVPENLAARVPEGVGLEKAAFATVGAVAMQGIRIGNPSLGEVAAVIGLGLIGQLAAQMLRANGCRVLAIDIAPGRVAEARAQGAEWAYRAGEVPDSWSDMATEGQGADLALVTAAATTSAPIQSGASLCRHKGRVVLVGMMPMELDRRIFYEKELELRMSTSYGPGRYDRSYEEVGLDYPLPYVRWTENRNLQSFLALCRSGQVDPALLETRTVPFEEAGEAYEGLAAGKAAELGIVFRYQEAPSRDRSITLGSVGRTKPAGVPGIALIGAGSYANGVLLPALGSGSALRRTHVITATGPSGKRTAERHGFAACGTDVQVALEDPETDLLIIATRHDTHASLAAAGLRKGKAVWVEKPVALDEASLAELETAATTTGGFLTVGYNRRFSRHARALREALEGRAGPLALHYVVAAGSTPAGTWLLDPKQGGGRIVGEVCHFVDLATYLAGCLPESVFAWRLGADPARDDSTVLVVRFQDRSVASIEYLANAGADLPKERMELSWDGKTASCENFRTTHIPGRRALKTVNQDKGQAQALAEVIEAVRSGSASPFSLAEILAVARTTFAAEESMRTGSAVRIEAARGAAP